MSLQFIGIFEDVKNDDETGKKIPPLSGIMQFVPVNYTLQPLNETTAVRSILILVKEEVFLRRIVRPYIFDTLVYLTFIIKFL
jgi:hypothetical protein